ncbi:MAG TPA: nuclear transport factor 2 family protein [Pyrinomonadaceae bacterium]|jgi:hypothetical protein
MKRICVTALLATVLSVSQLACSSGNQQSNAPANTNAPTITNSPATANNPTQNTATRETADNNDKNPFTELVMLYSQFFTARMKGDKAKVEGLLADDYKETTADGKVLNKGQVLAAINDSRKADPFSMDNLKSNEAGDTGTVTGRVSVTGQGNQSESWDFTTTFKKQQDKWRATSTKITNYKKS